ncbi:FHIPEP family protein [Clostridioides difficile 655]|nr:FHIPEP family protein [Clostridioides difficile 655]
MARSICNNLVDEDKAIVVATLSPETEELVSNNLQRSVNGTYPAVDPENTNKIFESIQEVMNNVYFNHNIPV